MKVTVEPDLCEANGLCVLAAPGVFDLIDDDVVDILVPEPPPDMESAVADAVMACPKQALRLLADRPQCSMRQANEHEDCRI
jgi:ferredoxin